MLAGPAERSCVGGAATEGTTVTRSAPRAGPLMLHFTATGAPGPTMPVDSITPTFGIGDMHGAALAAAPRRRCGPSSRRRRPAARPLPTVAVQSAVGGDEPVVGTQRDPDTGCHRPAHATASTNTEEFAGSDALARSSAASTEPSNGRGASRSGVAVITGLIFDRTRSRGTPSGRAAIHAQVSQRRQSYAGAEFSYGRPRTGRRKFGACIWAHAAGLGHDGDRRGGWLPRHSRHLRRAPPCPPQASASQSAVAALSGLRHETETCPRRAPLTVLGCRLA